ncbi:subtilisin-like protein [Corynespora cassiicola Philippines]|uniref:Subtilisin-like protein n=1 Tax=Corynespora cassiicola Philippines TaxID=1448308 RepID=A0A2T2P8J2_CORCC|nr:subtilisin-like protein [Corynespora cassiicola Philippines]
MGFEIATRWLLIFALFLQSDARSLNFNLSNSAIVPGAFLVEFEDGADQPMFLADVSSKSLTARSRVTIDGKIFKGASYQFDIAAMGENPAQLLSELPTVKNFWPVTKIKRPDDKVNWNGVGNALTSIQSEGYAPHIITQVDRLHGAGVTGKGIRIGIVDSGIDYLHPALGGGFGPGFLVARGYDHIGDSPPTASVPITDGDPYENCDGHGTHVAGIIAAQKNELGFTGAAYESEIGMYRVFGCTGDSTDDVVTAGISKAFDDGNHIISGSLGKYSNWPHDPMAVLLDRITKAGVICVFSQGNTGFGGPFFGGTPASAKNAIAVASTESTYAPQVLYNASLSIGNDSLQSFGWSHGIPSAWGNISFPLYIGNSSADLHTPDCNEFVNAPNLTNHIVMIRLESACSEWGKARFATEKGAQHALFYTEDTDETGSLIFPNEYGIPKGVGWLPRPFAQEFIKLYQSGKELTLHITDPAHAHVYVNDIPNLFAGSLSEFSSWGPTWELDVKPDIAAPGGQILSTYPVRLGSYAGASGTSMSAPLITGIVALLLSVRKDLSMDDIKSLLATTAKPINHTDSTTALLSLAPVPQQGSGIVQAWSALHATSIIHPSKLLLNDTEHFLQSHALTIRNTGDKPVTYILSASHAPTFFTLNPDSPSPPTTPSLQLSPSTATLTFSTPNITIPAGETATLELSFAPPASLDAARIPLYSGFVHLTSTSTTPESHSIPYLGAVGRLRKALVMTQEDFSLAYSGPSGIAPAAPGSTFTLPRPATAPGNTTSTSTSASAPEIRVPIFVAGFELGVPKWDIELWALRGAPSRNETGGGAELERKVGGVAGFPMRWWSRGVQTDGITGAGGDAVVPEGAYTFLCKGLRVFGVEAVEGDWDVVRSVDFWLRYA